MAAKTGKGKNKGSHASRLNDAMKSINNNRTPISSILPVQKQGNFNTSAKPGSRSGNFSGPQKLLLAVTNPGERPSAPAQVTDPADSRNSSIPNSSYASTNRLASFNTRTNSWDTRHRNYSNEHLAFQTARNNFSTYTTDLNTYENQELPRWTTADTEYKRGNIKNRSKQNQYKRDLAKFYNKKTRPTTSVKSGSRSVGRTSSKGSRR